MPVGLSCLVIDITIGTDARELSITAELRLTANVFASVVALTSPRVRCLGVSSFYRLFYPPVYRS